MHILLCNKHSHIHINIYYIWFFFVFYLKTTVTNFFVIDLKTLFYF